jgi:hypothetical protein
VLFDKNTLAAAGSSILAGFFRASLKLCVAVIALALAAPTSPSSATENIVYVSTTGDDGNPCTATQPCADITGALTTGGATTTGGSVQVVCLDGTANNGAAFGPGASNTVIDVDCPKGFAGGFQFGTEATNTTVRLRHLGLKGIGPASGEFIFGGNGTVILEECVFTDAGATALVFVPNGPLNLVVRNSLISNNAVGVLLQPQSGASIQATFDHVTIDRNNGGGIKADATNGLIDLDVNDSVISNNAGNGINAVAGGSSQAMVSIKNGIIAKNGAAGVQANGANAGVLLATTLLDQNAAGALVIVSGGNVLTYGNNQIVGSQGSNFSGTAMLK